MLGRFMALEVVAKGLGTNPQVLLGTLMPLQQDPDSVCQPQANECAWGRHCSPGAVALCNWAFTHTHTPAAWPHFPGCGEKGEGLAG